MTSRRGTCSCAYWRWIGWTRLLGGAADDVDAAPLGYTWAMSRVSASVELDPASRQALRAALDVVAPTVLDTMRDGIERVRLAAVGRWPVARPRGAGGRLPNPVHSRDRFRVVERVSVDAVEVAIVNDAPYVLYIRSGQNGLGGKSAWVQLVRRPGEVEAERVASESGAELAALIGGAK